MNFYHRSFLDTKVLLIKVQKATPSTTSESPLKRKGRLCVFSSSCSEHNAFFTTLFNGIQKAAPAATSLNPLKRKGRLGGFISSCLEHNAFFITLFKRLLLKIGCCKGRRKSLVLPSAGRDCRFRQSNHDSLQ